MRTFDGTHKLRGTALAGLALLWASVATAQNSSQATAASIGTGQLPAVFTLSPSTPERWYVFRARTYRSYCIQVLPATDDPGHSDLTLELSWGTFSTSQPNLPFTLLPGFDPDPGDRAVNYCDAIWDDRDPVYLRVLQRGASVGTTTSHQLRVVETTLFAPRFEVDAKAGIDSSIQLSNTTSVIFGVSVTVFDQAGRPLLSLPQIDFNLTPYGSTEIVLSRTGLTRAVRSIVISHYGNPGAVAVDLQTSRHSERTSVPFRPREDYR